MKKNYIGDRITSLRMEKDISEYCLSRGIGKCNNYINKVSSGAIKPSLDTLIAICDFFEISLSQFFAEDTENLSLTALKISSLLPKLKENQLKTLLMVIDSMETDSANQTKGSQ